MCINTRTWHNVLCVMMMCCDVTGNPAAEFGGLPACLVSSAVLGAGLRLQARVCVLWRLRYSTYVVEQ